MSYGFERPWYSNTPQFEFPTIDATLLIYRYLHLLVDSTDTKLLSPSTPEAELLLLFWTALKSKSASLTLAGWGLNVDGVGPFALQTKPLTKANSQVSAIITPSTYDRLIKNPDFSQYKLQPLKTRFKFDGVDTTIIELPLNLGSFKLFIGNNINLIAHNAYASLQDGQATPLVRKNKKIRLMILATESLERIEAEITQSRRVFRDYPSFTPKPKK